MLQFLQNAVGLIPNSRMTSLVILVTMVVLQQHAEAQEAPTSDYRSKIGAEFAVIKDIALEAGQLFAIQKTEVSTRQFAAFVEATSYESYAEKHPSELHQTWREHVNDLDKPVVYVALEDMIEFCRWAERVEGVKCRLPIVEEWEICALAGQEEKKLYRTRRFVDVGTSEPNRWGLTEMLGNVREVCDGWRATGKAARPSEVAKGMYICVRGGSWLSAPEFLKPRKADWTSANFCCDNVGFRVVFELPPNFEGSPTKEE